MTNDCTTCEACEEILGRLNTKLIAIGDARLYNIRFELGREVDYDLYKLLLFYKGVLTDICDGNDCDCYTVDGCSPTNVTMTVNELDNTVSVPNYCVCGCCEPLNPVCTAQVPCPGNPCAPCTNTQGKPTTEDILERIKILLA